MRTAPWWLRRDLRLADNQALSAALTEAEQVIPVFALDPALLDSPRAGPKRVAFLMGGLQELDMMITPVVASIRGAYGGSRQESLERQRRS